MHALEPSAGSLWKAARHIQPSPVAVRFHQTDAIKLMLDDILSELIVFFFVFLNVDGKAAIVYPTK